jgi:hypothetical protein
MEEGKGLRAKELDAPLVIRKIVAVHIFMVS